jgi:hypothetical protein
MTFLSPLFSGYPTHEGVSDKENAGLNHMAIRVVGRPAKESQKNSCAGGIQIKLKRSNSFLISEL